MKLLRSALLALAPFLALAGATDAQTSHPRVLILVTSADHFTDGRPTGAWLEEFATPYNELRAAGVTLTIASPHGGQAPVDPRSNGTPVQEAAWKDARTALQHTTPLAEIHAADYDAVFIPGGHGPLFDLATDPASAALLSAFVRADKPIASVCHGPAALLNVTEANGTPFVAGKKITAFSDREEQAAGLTAEVPFSVQQKLTALGGQYSQGANFKPYAVVDGNLITGENPASSQQVAELLIKQLQAR